MMKKNKTNITIAYLGPEGSFSEKSAKSIAKKGDTLRAIQPVDRVVDTLIHGNPDKCVLPYYNSIEGIVQKHLDLIHQNKLNIIGANRVPIEFCIGKYPGSKDNNHIYSHAKGLDQCSRYIRQNYPKSELVEVASTSKAAERVREDQNGLAICSREALTKNGDSLDMIAEDIGNLSSSKNYTDFYVVSKDEQYNSDKGDSLTMVAITPHVDEVGLLSNILRQIEYYKLNMTKIHSRPALDKINLERNGEPQMFYIELEGHKDSDNFKRAMDAIVWKLSSEKIKNLEVIRVMGSYSKI